MPTKRYDSNRLFKDYGELTFARLLNAFRLCDELSQIAFAQRIGISAANLCDLEKGRKLPSAKRAATIAKKLGLPEALLIQVALQDQLRSQKLNFKVSVAA